MNLIWLHDDMLGARHPIFEAAGQAAKIVFVWDNDYFKAMNYSAKRLVFLYETLCELECEIIAGKAHNVIHALITEHKIDKIFTPYSPNPAHQKVMAGFKDIQIIEDIPFVKMPSGIVFPRFFRYWNKAKKTAFLKNGGHDS
jgi:hypothetical protein